MKTQDYKINILAIGVHPDDIELGCGGSLLMHIESGYSVGMLDLTQGELGSRGSAELRLQEAEDARAFIGAKWRHNCGMEDGFFTHTKDNILSIVKYIRLSKPDIVLCNAVLDRHPDHGRASQLISDACFYSGLIKIDVADDQGNLLEAHRPKSIYHYIQDKNLKPDFAIDITPYMERKIEAIMKFSSQFKADPNDGPQTPISSELFYQFLYGKARAYGRELNVDFAEGYTVERTIGVQNFFDLI